VLDQECASFHGFHSAVLKKVISRDWWMIGMYFWCSTRGAGLIDLLHCRCGSWAELAALLMTFQLLAAVSFAMAADIERPLLKWHAEHVAPKCCY